MLIGPRKHASVVINNVQVIIFISLDYFEILFLKYFPLQGKNTTFLQPLKVYCILVIKVVCY